MLKKAAFDPDHNRTLFVLFPRKVKDQEEVKKLHPGIETVRFTKRALRWCHIRFKTEELARQALKELHKKKVKHGRLVVSETKTRKKKELQEKAKKPGFYKLFISNIPEGATRKDIKSTFKTCQSIRIKPSKNSKSFKAIIAMRSFADAQDILADKESHKINGVPVIVQFTKSILNFTQDAKRTPKTVNVIGRKELEGVGTVNTNRQNIRNQYNHIMQNYKEIKSGKWEYSSDDSDVDTGCDMSLNKAEENIEKNSHIMQKYKAQICKEMKQHSNDDGTEEENLEGSREQNSEDDDVEGSEEQESDSEDDK